MIARLPAGPPLYPDGEITDEPLETRIAELIREAALDGVRDELPHSLAVLVDEMRAVREPARRPTWSTSLRHDLRGTRLAEGDRDGAQGLPARTSARGRAPRIEQLLGTRVYLDLHVTVAKDWQRDPKQLRKLGFDA